MRADRVDSAPIPVAVAPLLRGCRSGIASTCCERWNRCLREGPAATMESLAIERVPAETTGGNNRGFSSTEPHLPNRRAERKHRTHDRTIRHRRLSDAGQPETGHRCPRRAHCARRCQGHADAAIHARCRPSRRQLGDVAPPDRTTSAGWPAEASKGLPDFLSDVARRSGEVNARIARAARSGHEERSRQRMTDTVDFDMQARALARAAEAHP